MVKTFVMWIVAASIFLSGCSIISVGVHDDPPRVQMDGWVTCYAAVKGIRSWNGNIINLDIFSHDEVISAEVWPLAEAGIGVVGARAQVIPVEIALGTLFYHPTPENYWERPSPEPVKTDEKETAEPPSDE